MFIFVYSLPWRLSNNTLKARGRMPGFSSVPVKRIFVLYSLRVKKAKTSLDYQHSSYITIDKGKQLRQKWEKLKNYSVYHFISLYNRHFINYYFEAKLEITHSDYAIDLQSPIITNYNSKMKQSHSLVIHAQFTMSYQSFFWIFII